MGKRTDGGGGGGVGVPPGAFISLDLQLGWRPYVYSTWRSSGTASRSETCTPRAPRPSSGTRSQRPRGHRWQSCCPTFCATAATTRPQVSSRVSCAGHRGARQRAWRRTARGRTSGPPRHPGEYTHPCYHRRTHYLGKLTSIPATTAVSTTLARSHASLLPPPQALPRCSLTSTPATTAASYLGTLTSTPATTAASTTSMLAAEWKLLGELLLKLPPLSYGETLPLLLFTFRHFPRPIRFAGVRAFRPNKVGPGRPAVGLPPDSLSLLPRLPLSRGAFRNTAFPNQPYEEKKYHRLAGCECRWF